MSGSGAFEASTPAEAQTKPCRVSAITSGGRVRTTRADSRRITSSCRGSPSEPASRRASSEGSISARRTTRPSAFETTFWATHERRRRRAAPPPGDQRGEVVALADLRQPLDRRDRDGHGRPVSRRPGVDAELLVHVQDHRRHPLERAGVGERADVDRAATDQPAGKLERELLPPGVVPADERVQAAARPKRGRSRRRSAGRTRPAPAATSPGSPPASPPRGRARSRCR